jgi:hypothetical protein
MTLPVWKGLYETINRYLDGITLRDIIVQTREQEIDNYII